MYFKKNMTQLRQVLRKNVRFFILAYSVWRRFILFIDISVTIINIYQLVILFFSKLVHFENVWCE